MRYKVNKDGANKRVQTEGDPQVVSVGGNCAHSPWRSALVDVSEFIYARKGLALLFIRTSQLLLLAHPGNSPAGSTREAQTSHCPGCQQWPMNLLQSRGPPSGLWPTLVSALAWHCFHGQDSQVSQIFTSLGRIPVLLETHPHSYLESSSKGERIELFLASPSLFWERPPPNL